MHEFDLNQFFPFRKSAGIPENEPGLSQEILEKRIEDIDQKAKSAQGEFVLIIVRFWKPTIYDGPDWMRNYVLDKNMYLGIIGAQQPFLKEENYKLFFNTSLFVDIDFMKKKGRSR